MSAFLQLTLILTTIIFFAKIAGYLSTRLGQPSVFGELLVGILLGPTVIDVVHLSFVTDVHLGEIIHELGELGVLLLMFLAGLELEFHELARNSRVSAYSGLLGVVVPVGLGWGIGYSMGLSTNQAIFLGLTLGATSVSISAQTLMELKVLRSRVGLGLLGAAVFDDILVILLLSTFSAFGSGGGLAQIGLAFLKMLLFLGLSAGFGLFVLPYLTHKTAKLPISQGIVAFSMVILLIYGAAAELLGGMAAITGTFIAGLMFGRSTEKRSIEHGIGVLAYGFFVPIFFADIGLRVNVRELPANSLWLLFILCLAAILGKLIGSGLGARLGGFTWRESLQVGIGMVSRGEVGLIVASVGIAEGALSTTTFPLVVGMILITTLITPPLLRASISAPKPASKEA
jgi:Kef-type K+ transport system membrane component KefB